MAGRAAHHKQIGVVGGIVGGQHPVAAEGPTVMPAGPRAQDVGQYVDGDIVAFSAAGHGEYGSGHPFVADLGVLLAGEVLLEEHRTERGGVGHAPTVPPSSWSIGTRSR